MSVVGGKIRVLHATDGLGAGGKERQLLEMIRNMDKNDFAFGVVTFNSNQHYSIQARDGSAFYWELRKRPTRLEPLLSIWKCFRAFRPDMVHTWDSLSSFYAYLPCKILDIPLIDGAIRDAGIENGWQYDFKRFILKRADRVISNSHAGLKKYGVQGQVIYNAMDTSRFLPNKKTDEFNLVMTANFTAYKDHETFLKAAVELIKDGIVDQAYMPGAGPRRQKHVDWLADNYPAISGKIHFPGLVHNVEEFLANCRIGILCSTKRFSEGISNSVLEYMAAGLVPLMTDIGAAREIIEDGVNGFLFAPGNWKGIVNLVSQLKGDSSKRESIVRAAKKTVNERFELKTNIAEYASLYRGVMAGKRK